LSATGTRRILTVMSHLRVVLIASGVMIVAGFVAQVLVSAGESHAPVPRAADRTTNTVDQRCVADRITCLIRQIPAASQESERRRIYAKLRKLGVRCTGTLATEIDCSHETSDGGEGWVIDYTRATDSAS
jgi:hypothetical protein